MIIGIIVGLLVWLVVPLLFAEGKRKRKSRRQRIIEMTCRIVGIVIIAAALVSCGGRQAPVGQLEELASDMRVHSRDYSEDDWAAAAQSFDEICADIDSYRSEYTDEELRQIGRLKGKCAAYIGKKAMRDAQDQLHDALNELGGAFEGAAEVLGDDEGDPYEGQ